MSQQKELSLGLENWTNIDVRKCTCCQEEKQTQQTNCNWVIFQQEDYVEMCGHEIDVCFDCSSTERWFCFEHQYEYIRKLQREEIEKEKMCDYIGYGMDSPVYYRYSPIRKTMIIECRQCDKYYRICNNHPIDFYSICESCRHPPNTDSDQD